jgi:aminoglycoside phosphotransferase (APT) family kinase protein
MSVREERLPRTIDAVDSAWLTQALGVKVEIAGVDLVGNPWSSSLSRVQLEGGADAPRSVIVKISIGGQVRELIDAIGAYDREITFYRELAPISPVRVPHVYIVVRDPETGDFVLVMEDLAPLMPPDQLEGLTVAQSQSAVDGLARFHAFSWEHARIAALADHFPAMDSAAGRAQVGQFAHFFELGWPLALRHAGEALSPAVRRFGDRFGEFGHVFIAELATPRTLIHGELRADNLFFDETGEPILVDFQTMQAAAGISEVAYLLSQSLSTEVRRTAEWDLVRRYFDGLADAGVTGYPWERAECQYRLAVAMQFVYPVMAFTQFELTNDRGRALLIEMARRAAVAIEDNGSLSLLGGDS